MENVIAYRSGQRLAYVDVGDPGGSPVLVQHGMIASIRDYRLFSRLTDAGARLIAIARPGYGKSTPYVMANMAEWGDIVAALAAKLGLTHLDLLGISSGAPYSYAIGHALPDKVQRIFVLSGTPALYHPEIQARWPYPITENATIPELQSMSKELFFPGMSVDDASSADVQDSMMNDCFGIAQDLRLRCRDWGFRLSDVRPHVVMQHSRLDDQVPLATARITSKLLSDCELIIREDGEHFSPDLLAEFIESRMMA